MPGVFGLIERAGGSASQRLVDGRTAISGTVVQRILDDRGLLVGCIRRSSGIAAVSSHSDSEYVVALYGHCFHRSFGHLLADGFARVWREMGDAALA